MSRKGARGYKGAQGYKGARGFSRAFVGAVAVAIVLAAAARAQPPYDVKAHYVKGELFIPMRDGVKLFTIVYTPRDATKTYPLLMTRTAYGIATYGADA